MGLTKKYEAIIGLEVHIQLQTRSKAFCGDSTLFGSTPNSQTSTISLAHPGTLPRPNKKQIEYAIILGLALNCEINQQSYFDRKHYFYADLPKGFQTTQNSQPICKGGEVTFETDQGLKTIRLHHIHMEEDAGKSLHEIDPTFTYIDLNRAGIPLLEMVTEPDFRTANEVYHFINELRRLVRYLDISDGNMEEGSLRCDCNISVRLQGQETLNARCEVKNINSARFARKAIEFEIGRQMGLMEDGHEIKQETREFNPDQGITTALRSKEDAHDYRYFPEPDILPLHISEGYITGVRNAMPSLPAFYRQLLINQYGLAPDDVEIIIDTQARVENFRMFLDRNEKIPPKLAANFFINKWFPSEEAEEISKGLDFKIIAQFLQLIEDKKITTSIAYQKIWPILIKQPQDVLELCQKLNLMQTSDTDTIESMAQQVLDENPRQLGQYINGKKGIITFFMGQLMKISEGKANPEIARETFEKLLGK
ncbi:MAG: Asp-tRNA(Asn)/Glu-tRNA(Gln) amidotransferase subunit GatB [Saprospiraceae bacterium]|nr:Asp-tRNA(Asn)/Glu-tRNA(Gln) amidotransferase subunit GatB [Saprospiraceae bacterium]